MDEVVGMGMAVDHLPVDVDVLVDQVDREEEGLVSILNPLSAFGPYRYEPFCRKIRTSQRFRHP
jgi:hypothetical protein